MNTLRRAAVAASSCLAVALTMVACDTAPTAPTGPWEQSIISPVHVVRQPPVNFGSMTVASYDPDGFTAIRIMTPTFSNSEYTSIAVHYPDHCNRTHLISYELGGLVIEGGKTVESACRNFTYGFRTPNQTWTGDLFPLVSGKQASGELNNIDRNGSSSTVSATFKGGQVTDGITLNGMHIFGPIYDITITFGDGSANEELWSELLGFPIMIQSTHKDGSVGTHSEIVAASGVQPKTINGVQVAFAGNGPDRPPTGGEALAMLADFNRRPAVAAVIAEGKRKEAAAQRQQEVQKEAMAAKNRAAFGTILGAIGAMATGTNPGVAQISGIVQMAQQNDEIDQQVANGETPHVPTSTLANIAQQLSGGGTSAGGLNYSPMGGTTNANGNSANGSNDQALAQRLTGICSSTCHALKDACETQTNAQSACYRAAACECECFLNHDTRTVTPVIAQSHTQWQQCVAENRSAAASLK